jgi:hypothetical protein
VYFPNLWIDESSLHYATQTSSHCLSTARFEGLNVSLISISQIWFPFASVRVMSETVTHCRYVLPRGHHRFRPADPPVSLWALEKGVRSGTNDSFTLFVGVPPSVMSVDILCLLPVIIWNVCREQGYSQTVLLSLLSESKHGSEEATLKCKNKHPLSNLSKWFISSKIAYSIISFIYTRITLPWM